MTAVIETEALGKRYRRLWALADCTLNVPAGHVVGLVGPNGAGKTTLLNLAAGLLAPTTGTIEVLGGPAPASPAQLARVGFLAQDSPVYAGLSVADHLALGAHLNPGWDAGLARSRIERLELDPGQKAGKLSGGQRGPAGPAGVPAGPDGGHRRAEPVRGAVLPPSRGPGTGLRPPDRAGRLAGAGRGSGRGPAGHSSPAHRPAPGPGHAASRAAGHLRQPHRPADHAAGAHQRPGPRPRLDCLRDRPGRPGSGLHEPGNQTRPPRPGGAEMIWLTWRQFRVQAITAVATLAAFAVLLAVTGPHLASLYAASGITGCHGGSCGQLASSFLSLVGVGIYPV